eukprot:6174522-Pleurochrysis_carterae.AAC.1
MRERAYSSIYDRERKRPCAARSVCDLLRGLVCRASHACLTKCVLASADKINRSPTTQQARAAWPRPRACVRARACAYAPLCSPAGADGRRDERGDVRPSARATARAARRAGWRAAPRVRPVDAGAGCALARAHVPASTRVRLGLARWGPASPL